MSRRRTDGLTRRMEMRAATESFTHDAQVAKEVKLFLGRRSYVARYLAKGNARQKLGAFHLANYIAQQWCQWASSQSEFAQACQQAIASKLKIEIEHQPLGESAE